MKANLSSLYHSHGSKYRRFTQDVKIIVFHYQVFIVGLFYSSYLVAKDMNNPETIQGVKSSTASIAAHFFLMFAVAILHRFLVIPAFNREKDLENKALMAFISPLLAFLVTSISQYLVLACPNPLLSDQNHNRMYVLVYFNQLLPLALFRVMQADFNDWGWFLGMSLIYGFASLLSDATRELRKKCWNTLWNRPNVLFDGHSQRLQTDLNIQYCLFHYALIMLSQVYITMYRYSTFDIPLEGEIGRMFGRAAVGLVIEVFLNSLSVWLQVRFCGRKIKEVWLKCYKNHALASLVLVTFTICYFSQVLFSVLHVPMASDLAGYRVRNCSSPFTYE